MSTFLLKLHCKNDIGGAEPHPSRAAQWEDARLRFKTPSRINGGRGADVVDGDTLIVWTHEDPSYGGGHGLTAEGIARYLKQEADNTMSATLTQVRLFEPHFRLRGWPGGATGSEVINYLLRHLHTRTYELEDTELAEFRRVVETFAVQTKTKFDSSPHSAEEDKALLADKEAVLDGFERRFSRQETRPSQADFRAALMSRYRGKCAITNCSVEAALQAAHIVPFSESIALRNEPKNGLLLRADVHALFDKALLSVNPEGYRVELSEMLQGTQYWGLKGAIVEPPPAKQFVTAQYLFFKKKQG